jgi:putative oxidoreductase
MNRPLSRNNWNSLFIDLSGGQFSISSDKIMMESGTLQNLSLSLLRIVSAVMLIIFHAWGLGVGAYGMLTSGQGWGFAGLVSQLGFPFGKFFALCAAAAELAAAMLLIVGLFTRYAALLLLLTLTVALYYHFRIDIRGVELAALYFLIALVFLFIKPGKYSLDELLENRRGKPSHA